MTYFLGHSVIIGFALVIIATVALVCYMLHTYRLSEHLDSEIEKNFGSMLAGEAKKAEKKQYSSQPSPKTT